ncbi:MAG: YfiR family protein [Ignavibacteriae bacterium]|nr:YfiR family protein [Ignavibacteriota bacterium]
MRRTVFSFALVAAVFLVPLTPRLLQAQEVEIPVDMQVSLFSRILTFDRALAKPARQEFVIGILYQKNVRISSELAAELQHAADVQQVQSGGQGLRFVPLPIRDLGDVESAIKTPQLDAVYVTPLRLIDIRALSDATRRRGILSLTGVPEYVEKGIAVGLESAGNRAQIIVNLAAATAEGADFSAKLLNIARVVQR